LQNYYTYNGFGEITKEQLSTGQRSRDTVFYVAEYKRDNTGRIIEKKETALTDVATYKYNYDFVGRLTSVLKDDVEVESYTYDFNGNRTVSTLLTDSTVISSLAKGTSQASQGLQADGTVVSTVVETSVTSRAVYDDQDRLTSYGGNTYAYDERGNLESKTDADGGIWTYEYDEFGNLISVVTPGLKRIDYVIDGLNRRIGKKVDGVLKKSWTYKDQLNPIAEYDANGVLEYLFLYGEKGHVPEYIYNAKTTGKYKIVTDQVGSVRLIVQSGGKRGAYQRIDYDSFGRVLNDTSPGFQPFGFAGGLYDPDTGLVRFGARDYDPEIGRWLSKDPIRFDGGINLYAYVNNDPVNIIDPSGLQNEHHIKDFCGPLGTAIARVAGLYGLIGGPIARLACEPLFCLIADINCPPPDPCVHKLADGSCLPPKPPCKEN